MKHPVKHFRAFTAKANGRALSLVSKVELSLPFDPAIDSSRHEKQDCEAIWDTGASVSAITESMVARLSLKPTGKRRVQNTSVVETKDTYIVNIFLPNKVLIPFVNVVECKNLVGGYGMLIGMDIIGVGDFSVTNVDNKTVMSYRIPSLETIDYVAMAKTTREEIERRQVSAIKNKYIFPKRKKRGRKRRK